MTMMLVMALSAPAPAKTYHVSPSGDDAAEGTRADPWRTLDRAARAQAGDEVIFMDGVYPGYLRPLHDGRADAPIIFRSGNRLGATLTGPRQAAPDGFLQAIQILGRQHIRIAGFHIRPENPMTGRWVAIQGQDPGHRTARHIEVRDCLMEYAAGSSWGNETPAKVEFASHIRWIDNILRYHAHANMMNVFYVDHLLFEGNGLSHASHDPLAVSTDIGRVSSCDHLVFRGNIWHAGWGRGYEQTGDVEVLYENNLLLHSLHGGMSAGPESNTLPKGGIYRMNRVFRNWGTALNLGYYNRIIDARAVRWYNNVFDDNLMRVIRMSDVVADYIFENNVFSRSDQFSDNTQMTMGGKATDFVFRRNIFWAPKGEIRFDSTDGGDVTLDQVQSAQWQHDFGRQFVENRTLDPQFVDIDNYQHVPRKDSPLIDAGVFLTRAAKSGKGMKIQVVDARYFYDGYGMEGERGDLIAIGRPDQVVEVRAVDYLNNTIWLDRVAKWTEGDPVSLPWAGTAPDIGMYEIGGGRPSVQIQAASFIVRPDEPVALSAVVYGDFDPVRYHWRFGDATIAAGEQVSHAFPNQYNPPNSPSGYPVWCRVTGRDGRELIGTHYLEMARAETSPAVLLHTNFNADRNHESPETFFDSDANWWWVWYDSRPRPTDSQLFLDQGEGGALRQRAPADGASMACYTSPALWAIDRYPIIRMRYRVEPGTPVGCYLQGFNVAGKERRVWMALSPAADPENLPRVGKDVLIDDGGWHVLEFDARRIREVYEGITVLRSVGMRAAGLDRVKTNHAYWLDDFMIRTETD